MTAKVAKVIATCFKAKKVVNKTALCGDPLGFYNHSQNFTTEKDFINLINYLIDLENNSNPGCERDLIIVNSDIGSQNANNFIESLNNKKISHGKILTLNRKNIGMSYGSYSDAFIKFRNYYDYFLFTEDDMAIIRDNYLKIGLDIFKTSKDIGFLAYIGINKYTDDNRWKQPGIKKKDAISCHGATGLSSTIILNKVIQTHGCLPHHKGLDYNKSITYGEVAFPNSIIQLGYRLSELPKEIILTEPTYDLMRGIKYRRYPTILEKFYYYFKNYTYIIFSKNKFLFNIYSNLVKYIKN